VPLYLLGRAYAADKEVLQRNGLLGAAEKRPDPWQAATDDNKYIDNSKTYRTAVKTNSVGVEFAGNFPDVAKPASAEQIAAWRILVRVLQARYGILLLRSCLREIAAIYPER
jgi:hypothetical protein